MKRSPGLYRRFFKRLLDVALSLVACILLSPVFLVLTLFLYVANQGQPFFLQARPGKGGRVFTIVKFRTMTGRRDARGELLPDAERLTAIGKFVRKTSLDELPQLWNVLLGDMSLVGPRPLLVDYLPLYNADQARRHEVSPGITGWAQVNGRNHLSWEEKFKLDVHYVDHLTFLLDAEILWRTVAIVLKREGIASAKSVSMGKFQGDGG